MPESVNRRGSSGPTIGAIAGLSGFVAMRVRLSPGGQPLLRQRGREGLWPAREEPPRQLRGGARLDSVAQVLEREQHANRRDDLEVRGVRRLAADRAVGDERVDAGDRV